MEKMDYGVIRGHVSDMLRYARNNDERIVNSGVNYFKEGMKNPFVAKMLKRDEIHVSTKKMVNDSLANGEGISGIVEKTKNTFANLIVLKKNEAYSAMQDKFNAEINELYPSTSAIREKLIDSKKIVLDRVTPKAGAWKKFKLLKYMPL